MSLTKITVCSRGDDVETPVPSDNNNVQPSTQTQDKSTMGEVEIKEQEAIKCATLKSDAQTANIFPDDSTQLTNTTQTDIVALPNVMDPNDTADKCPSNEAANTSTVIDYSMTKDPGEKMVTSATVEGHANLVSDQTDSSEHFSDSSETTEDSDDYPDAGIHSPPPLETPPQKSCVKHKPSQKGGISFNPDDEVHLFFVPNLTQMKPVNVKTSLNEGQHPCWFAYPLSLSLEAQPSLPSHAKPSSDVDKTLGIKEEETLISGLQSEAQECIDVNPIGRPTCSGTDNLNEDGQAKDNGTPQPGRSGSLPQSRRVRSSSIICCCKPCSCD